MESMVKQALSGFVVKDIEVGVDKATLRFLVRFQIGPQAWSEWYSLSPEKAAELSAAVVKRLSKLVTKH